MKLKQLKLRRKDRFNDIEKTEIINSVKFGTSAYRISIERNCSVNTIFKIIRKNIDSPIDEVVGDFVSGMNFKKLMEKYPLTKWEIYARIRVSL
jgi:Mor family transcriptional regulator